MKLYAPNSDSPFPTHTYIYTLRLSVGCLVSGKCSLLSPQGHCFACGALWLSFSFYPLSHSVSEHHPFFITCSFSFRENHQADTIESFSFSLFSLPVAPCYPTHLCLSPFCTVLHQNCASQQKGHRCLHR